MSESVNVLKVKYSLPISESIDIFLVQGFLGQLFQRLNDILTCVLSVR